MIYHWTRRKIITWWANHLAAYHPPSTVSFLILFWVHIFETYPWTFNILNRGIPYKSLLVYIPLIWFISIESSKVYYHYHSSYYCIVIMYWYHASIRIGYLVCRSIRTVFYFLNPTENTFCCIHLTSTIKNISIDYELEVTDNLIVSWYSSID